MKAIKPKTKGRVLVAISGGVDSAVAAALLLKQGYEVAAVFLHFWKDPSAPATAENKCCSLTAMNDARAVCRKLGIPFHSFDFSAPFKKAVVDNFLEEYAAGRTPNPCIICNRRVKIGRLLEYARGLGYDFLATGHYVNIKSARGKFSLYRAKDKNKDQSYFLYTFNSEQLKQLLFPLGNYTKPQVRALAKKFGLPVAEKAESQEICFISGKHHNDFLKRNLKLKSGEIKLLDTGEVIGTHQGLPLYTIGQRRGIEIGGRGPYYAARMDYQTNDLFVARKFDDIIFYEKSLLAKDVIWTNDSAPLKSFKCQAVIRYRHPAVACRVTPPKKPGQGYLVEFDKPQRAVTPGQSVVFYKDSKVLGGGIINLPDKK